MIEISILILTHNAPKYVEETLRTLNEVTDRETLSRCEIVVLDNDSEQETRSLLGVLKAKGWIDKLEFSPVNTFFARGNNLAAQMSDKSARYYLLLNSDVSIRHSNWLRELIDYKEEGGYGAAAFGACRAPERADGYCLLIDRELYDRHQLDENFEWWGGVTKLQCELLKEGYNILAIDHHDSQIYHYGGKSGRTYKEAKKMDVDPTELLDCFANSRGKVVVKNHSEPSLWDKIVHKFRKVETRLRQL